MKEIILTQGQKAIVDDEDYGRLIPYKWYANKVNGKYWRAYRTGYNRQLISMSRFILNAPKGKVVDHINHDTLDNRKENLRICSVRQNGMNRKKGKGKSTSKYKGVSFNKSMKRWQSIIQVKGRQKHLGYFAEEIEAAKAYDSAAKKYFNDFAELNMKLKTDVANKEF